MFEYSNEKSINYMDISPINIENHNSECGFSFSDEEEENIYTSNALHVSNQKDNSRLQNIEEKEILEKNLEKKIEKKIKEDDITTDRLEQLSIELPSPLGKKEKIKDDEKSNKSTNFKTKKEQIKIDKCIFGVKSQRKIEPRIDYAIKNFKVYLCKYLKDYGNKIIKQCDFPKKLKNLKLFSASYKYFTGVSNEKENKIFFNFTIEKIFSYPEGKIEKNNNRLQRQNKEIIKSLKDYIDEKYSNKIPDKFQQLLNYFNMTFQEAIVNFYESKKFEDYSSSPKTRYLDEQIIKAKGFSLLEKNSFFKLMKNYNKRTEQIVNN